MLSTRSHLFLSLVGAPHDSDLATSLLRLVHEAISQGHQVTVWVCGGGTTLTLNSHGDTKIRNLIDAAAGNFNREYPSTTKLIKELIEVSEGRLQWLICRHCMQEWGATNQINEVKVTPPYKFLRYIDQANVSMVMGIL
ncbi:MAG: hypothetical protein C6Y22_24945 [Hapalosiphonaceae cyanobacterium JJU2]|jgi:DsrE/DsrF-like family|nr:MAG: hypothetical protein C6Y22_24945 [Hapalosiphonaceae cyanobacterium JJU2]